MGMMRLAAVRLIKLLVHRAQWRAIGRTRITMTDQIGQSAPAGVPIRPAASRPSTVCVPVPPVRPRLLSLHLSSLPEAAIQHSYRATSTTTPGTSLWCDTGARLLHPRLHRMPPSEPTARRRKAVSHIRRSAPNRNDLWFLQA